MIIPIGDRVLIRPTSPEEQSKGGIVLKSKDPVAEDTGTVVSIGDGEQVQRFKYGDNLLFQRYGPTRTTITHKDGSKEEMVIAYIDEIIAIDKE